MVWMSWHWIFVCQSAIALIALIGVMRSRETLKEKSTTSALETVKIYLQLLNNRRYMAYALMVSLVALPLFAFIGGAADIYIKRYGLSEQQFGYLFGFNALAVMVGSLLCTRLMRWLSSGQVMTVGFAGILFGGLLMLLELFRGPWALAVPMAVITFFLGLSRPPGNNLVLEQAGRFAGAASSLLVFIFFTLGAFSMWLISFDWSDKIRVIAILASGVGAVVLVLWLLLSEKPVAVQSEAQGCMR